MKYIIKVEIGLVLESEDVQKTITYLKAELPTTPLIDWIEESNGEVLDYIHVAIVK